MQVHMLWRYHKLSIALLLLPFITSYYSYSVSQMQPHNSFLLVPSACNKSRTNGKNYLITVLSTFSLYYLLSALRENWNGLDSIVSPALEIEFRRHRHSYWFCSPIFHKTQVFLQARWEEKKKRTDETRCNWADTHVLDIDVLRAAAHSE